MFFSLCVKVLQLWKTKVWRGRGWRSPPHYSHEKVTVVGGRSLPCEHIHYAYSHFNYPIFSLTKSITKTTKLLLFQLPASITTSKFLNLYIKKNMLIDNWNKQLNILILDKFTLSLIAVVFITICAFQTLY